MPDLFCDLETYSEEPINSGVHRYVEGNCEVMLWTYAIGDGPVGVWDLTANTGMPRDLRIALNDEGTAVWFQNGGHFDFVVIDRVLPAIGSLIAPHRRRDTLVQALSHGLPGALDKLGSVLGMAEEERKIADGKRLVRLFCGPHEVDGKKVRYGRDTHPAEWQRFIEYAKGDIVTMRVAHTKMPQWNYREKQLALWHLDCQINNRGFAVDLDLAEAAVRESASERNRLAADVSSVTGGVVGAATQRDALLAYLLAEHGVELPDMQSDTLERRLADENLPSEVKDLLQIRLQASRNSAAKFRALLKGVSADSRLRGCAQFRGASRTGRWAHRRFQPGNLMRPTMSHEMIEVAIAALKNGSIDLVFGDVMQAIGNTVRGVIVAPPGRKLVVADLSNIEGRVAAWLAGEDWKVRAFKDFDESLIVDVVGKPILNAKGERQYALPDLYILAYAKSFNVPPESVPKKGPERQIGKVEELMFQYGGGVGAWITGAATYGIDLVKMTEQVFPSLPMWAVDEATDYCRYLEDEAAKKVKEVEGETYEARREKIEAAMAKALYGLLPKVFVACDAIKRLWRRAHPQITSYWKELEESVRYCIDNPGETLTARRVKIRRDGAWLRVMLPSGRYLCYPNPRINKAGSIVFTGLNQYTKQWGEVATYGGKLCLAAGTQVLTRALGWVPIECITSVDEVWDGDQWVKTAGLLRNGWAPVMNVFGVQMTADHEVLTTEGWRRASQSSGHYRASCRVPDGFELPGKRREEVDLACAMRLRHRDYVSGYRAPKTAHERRQSVVRLHAFGDHQSETHEARHVSTPGIRGLEVDARQMSATDPPSVGALRWPWHSGVQAVVRWVRSFLGGHGVDLQTRSYARAQEQRTRVCAGQLRVGDPQGAGGQYPSVCSGGRSVGGSSGSSVGRQIRGQALDNVLPFVPRGEWNCVAQSGGRYAEVFDLMDCGPQHRFTVWGDNAPLLVHNCENIVQAVACDQLAEPMLEIENQGFEIVMHVHDEIISEVPDTEEYTADRLAELMCANLGWNEGLPLAAAGFETNRYRKD